MSIILREDTTLHTFLAELLIFFSFLLVYMNCKRGFIVVFPFRGIMYFDQIHALYYSFLSPFPLNNFNGLHFPVFFSFLGEGVSSRLCTCKAGALPLEPHLHFALVILEMGAHKLFAWAGLEPISSRSQVPK
jgi:hypothetical protein